jgi:hypothetical protein
LCTISELPPKTLHELSRLPEQEQSSSIQEEGGGIRPDAGLSKSYLPPGQAEGRSLAADAPVRTTEPDLSSQFMLLTVSLEVMQRQFAAFNIAANLIRPEAAALSTPTQEQAKV